MKVLRTFRHEYKYTITQSELLKIKYKLKQIMDVDRDFNGYAVRSLYFDSINDNDYNEKLMGVMVRKKLRLRIYDGNSDFVKLEIKNKYDYHQLKESLIIDKKTAFDLIEEKYDTLLKYDNDLAKKIYNIMRSNCYKPKVIVEYKRIAFVSKIGTRITLDYKIKKSNSFDNFFDNNINYYNLVSDNVGVLEVKFNEFLEPYIGKIISEFISQNEAFSKYLMSRYNE